MGAPEPWPWQSWMWGPRTVTRTHSALQTCNTANDYSMNINLPPDDLCCHFYISLEGGAHQRSFPG